MEFESQALQWVEYDSFEDHPQIEARTFLRHGGVSEKNFYSLNLSDKVGDHPDSVKVNRDVIKKFLQIENIVFANQTHSDVIMEVTSKNFHQKFDCDVLVTKEKNIALAITHADCQAALLFDPEYQVIAAVHAGWRGLCKNIYQKTIKFMTAHFNSRPEAIIASISPSLCFKHSEFKDYKKDFPKELWNYQVKPFYFDLKKIAQDQLIKAGLSLNNIEFFDECTYCNSKDYFSFRREHKTGRHASVICLIK